MLFWPLKKTQEKVKDTQQMACRAVIRNWELKEVLPGFLRLTGDIYDDVTGTFEDGHSVTVSPILLFTANGLFAQTFSNSYMMDPPYDHKKFEQDNKKSKDAVSKSNVCEH